MDDSGISDGVKEELADEEVVKEGDVGDPLPLVGTCEVCHKAAPDWNEVRAVDRLLY